MNTLPTVIHTDKLSYRFGTQQVIHDLSLRVPQAAVYGFLGPNGAGKSTTIKLLLGLLQSADQEILLFGKSLATHRLPLLAQVGNLIEAPSLYRHLTAWENLRYLDLIFKMGKDRIAEILDLVGLSDQRDKKVKHFSLGTKQRLGIGMAMFHDPKLLFLDEPFNGLDPRGVQDMRALLMRLRDADKTIFISSHILAEIEKICSHVGIINQGKMMYQGTMHNLLSHSSKLVSLHTTNPAKVQQLCQDSPFQVETATATELRFKLPDSQSFHRLIYFLTDHKVDIHHIETWSPSLEDIFFNLTRQAS